ncbi:PhzF family phenazine biosynthesis protein [Maricaulis maris]|uniref:PhzF family phenazine biosynthesis protein n=1 Tax=Maricaulis maris TaxID=74318 RepID=A0A495DM16_9PROT|nr:PhzF family phenazine biosynthesis protein [Maricaulis maris]RKR03944.1 PhzF family phenazine biosynthesis protein [Maricaulis maris]
MTRSFPYYELHSFAVPGRPHSGNPAGVVLMDDFLSDSELLGIANSNNLSETAFLVPRGTDCWHLRWFTPAIEVDLCGHATFAAGAVVLEQGMVSGRTASFDTRSGRLAVSRDNKGDGFAMDLPAIGFETTGRATALEAALGLDTSPEAVFNVTRIHGARYQMWVMADEAAVRLAEPDHGKLRSLDTNIILTAPGEHCDFVSRFFAPASGVDEDPVTGSAHCTLAPYWGERLDKLRLSARQIGPRPGALDVAPKGERVTLYGHAPRYLEGRITV